MSRTQQQRKKRKEKKEKKETSTSKPSLTVAPFIRSNASPSSTNSDWHRPLTTRAAATLRQCAARSAWWSHYVHRARLPAPLVRDSSRPGSGFLRCWVQSRGAQRSVCAHTPKGRYESLPIQPDRDRRIPARTIALETNDLLHPSLLCCFACANLVAMIGVCRLDGGACAA